MNKLIVFFSILLLISAVALGQSAELNKKAPAFKLVDNEGKIYSLSDFAGKYVVLEWVNFDCPFVGKHYGSGNMQNLQKTYRDKNVVWLSICSSAEGKQGYFIGDELTDRLKKEKATPTAYLLDTDGKVGKMYNAKTTPHMYIINPKGELIYAGGIDDKPSTKKEDLKDARNYVSEVLDAALEGQPLPLQTSKPYGCSVKYK